MSNTENYSTLKEIRQQQEEFENSMSYMMLDSLLPWATLFKWGNLNKVHVLVLYLC